MKKKIQKIHLSNFTAKIISMIRIISISLKKLYSHKWQNKAFLFLCHKLRFMNMLLTIRQKHRARWPGTAEHINPASPVSTQHILFFISHSLSSHFHEMNLTVCHAKQNPSSPPLLHVSRPPKNTQVSRAQKQSREVL